MHPTPAPIDAVQTLAAQPGASGTGVPSLQFVDLAAQTVEQPTMQDTAAFARAVQAQSPALAVSPTEAQALPPPSGDSLGSRLAHQADALSHYVGGLQAQFGQATPPGGGPASMGAAQEAKPTGADGAHGSGLTDGAATMSGAVAEMERAYMFAIQATMASRGSTESTKIFNTLLKGQ